MTTPFGTPFQVQPRSTTSILIVEPTLGFDVSHSALNIPEGATPSSENFIMRDGRLEPRSTLSRIGAQTDIGIGILTGGTPANTVDDTRYIVVGAREDGAVVAGITQFWAYLSPGATSWQALNGTFVPAANDYWDFAQIFSDVNDENMIVGGVTSRGTVLNTWVVGGSSLSVNPLPGSPGARFVAAFNDYLVAANTAEDGVALPQRVRWSDRGSASSWTGGVSGFQDLLGARGGITRVLPLERRLIVFFEDEIWEGTPVDFPFTFNFQPLDTTVGCPFSWTAAVTPRGIVFMARNFQLYLLPKEGGTAQPVGVQLQRRIRESIVQPAKAFGAYDGVNDHYQFYYSSGASANFANRAAFLHFANGAWAPQSFDTQKLVLTRAFSAPLSTSHVSTWDDFTTYQPAVTWANMTESWDDLLGVGNESLAVLALSAATVFQYSAQQKQDSMESSGGSIGGLARTAFWQSKPQMSDVPTAQKSITCIEVEYVAPSASSLTVRTSPSQGAAFNTGLGLSLMTASQVTQMPAWVQQPARYPVFRVETSEQTGLELHRFHVTMRVGGR